jgi:hypothetical protein
VRGEGTPEAGHPASEHHDLAEVGVPARAPDSDLVQVVDPAFDRFDVAEIEGKDGIDEGRQERGRVQGPEPRLVAELVGQGPDRVGRPLMNRHHDVFAREYVDRHSLDGPLGGRPGLRRLDGDDRQADPALLALQGPPRRTSLRPLPAGPTRPETGRDVEGVGYLAKLVGRGCLGVDPEQAVTPEGSNDASGELDAALLPVPIEEEAADRQRRKPRRRAALTAMKQMPYSRIRIEVSADGTPRDRREICGRLTVASIGRAGPGPAGSDAGTGGRTAGARSVGLGPFPRQRSRCGSA